MKIQFHLFIVALMLCPLLSFAQKDSLTYFNSEVGISFSKGEELSRVYDLGGKLTGGISFPLIKNRIRLNPNISFNYFGNNFNEGTRDNLLFWNIGTIAELNSNVTKNVRFVPYTGIFYLLGNNYLTPRKDFQGDKIDLFSYRGIGFDLGLKVIIKNNIFVRINYQVVTVTGKIDEQIKNDFEEELGVNDALYDIIEFPTNEFSFNNLTLSIGYNLEIK